MRSLLRFSVFAAMVVFVAQPSRSQGITFDSTDASLVFTVGNTITYHMDTLTTSVDIGSQGASSWDFSRLHTTALSNLLSVTKSSTPFAGDFPLATHVLKDTAFNYSFYYADLSSWVTLKGTGYIYYGLTADLSNHGFKGSGNAWMNGYAFPAQGQWLNSPAAKEYSLPVQYQKSWTSSYTESLSGSATIGLYQLNFGPIQTTHTITYTVDAHGQMELPGSLIMEALRIRKVDRYSTCCGPTARVGFIFLGKNGATVQMTAGDTNATSGAISVSAVQWSIGVGEPTVPITLASLTATLADGPAVRLDWTTLSETENFGFYVQRRGSSESSFTELQGSFVAGHGTTVVPQKYSFMDTAPAAAGSWYRLRQVDLDGAEHFSDPVQAGTLTGVRGEIPTVFGLSQNYPNPFNPTTRIRYSIPQATPASGSGVQGVHHVTLAVYDMLGRQVALLVDEAKQPGSYEVTFDASGLASGLYLYKLTASGFEQARRLVVLK